MTEGGSDLPTGVLKHDVRWETAKIKWRKKTVEYEGYPGGLPFKHFLGTPEILFEKLWDLISDGDSDGHRVQGSKRARF